MEDINKNISLIKNKINTTTKSIGKNGNDVLLVAVSKTRTVDEINESIDCGITDIGENKVQEILEKYGKLKPVKWHMIGHLQTNKVRQIIDKVDMIHSVDSMKLAVEIDKRAKGISKTMDILIQVNAAQEESKFGVALGETKNLILDVAEKCQNIRICGLMCVAPFAEDPNDIKKYFKQVKEQYDEFSKLDNQNIDFKYLSMGMSHDFNVAIEAGSNLVRVGSAIYGARDYTK